MVVQEYPLGSPYHSGKWQFSVPSNYVVLDVSTTPFGDLEFSILRDDTFTDYVTIEFLVAVPGAQFDGTGYKFVKRIKQNGYVYYVFMRQV